MRHPEDRLPESRLQRAMGALRTCEVADGLKWSSFTVAGSVGLVASLIVVESVVRYAWMMAGWIWDIIVSLGHLARVVL